MSQHSNTSVHSLPPEERPRERLLTKGPAALSDQELLAIILGAGSGGIGVLSLAQQVLTALDAGPSTPDPTALADIRGIGPSKAAKLCAALEFARRRIRPEGCKIRAAEDVFPLLRHYADRKQEHFLCLSLNGAHEVLNLRVVSIGLLNSSPVHPREVYAEPLAERAAAVIVAHNHPSGQLEPSEADKAVTGKLKDAGEILGIPLLDHLIFGRTGFLSFKDRGWL